MENRVICSFSPSFILRVGIISLGLVLLCCWEGGRPNTWLPTGLAFTHLLKVPMKARGSLVWLLFSPASARMALHASGHPLIIFHADVSLFQEGISTISQSMPKPLRAGRSLWDDVAVKLYLQRVVRRIDSVHTLRVDCWCKVMCFFSVIALIFHSAPLADTCHKLRFNGAAAWRWDAELGVKRGADGAVLPSLMSWKLNLLLSSWGIIKF